MLHTIITAQMTSIGGKRNAEIQHTKMWLKPLQIEQHFLKYNEICLLGCFMLTFYISPQNIYTSLQTCRSVVSSCQVVLKTSCNDGRELGLN